MLGTCANPVLGLQPARHISHKEDMVDQLQQVSRQAVRQAKASRKMSLWEPWAWVWVWALAFGGSSGCKRRVDRLDECKEMQ